MTDVPPAPAAAVPDQASADRADAGGPGAALAGCRVLELSHSAAAVAGRVLADLGAEVIKLEPPGGEPARQAEPAFDGPDGQRHGFAFLAFNLGKRSVTVDTGTAAGREILTRLAAARQLSLSIPVRNTLLLHLPRAPAFYREAVARLDRAALDRNARITRILALEIVTGLLQDE